MAVNSYLFFTRCLLLSLFGVKKEKLIVRDLFNKFSYRYTLLELESMISPLRYFKKAMLLLWKRFRMSGEIRSDFFVHEEKTEFYHGDREYLEAVGLKDPVFIFRHSLINELNLFSKVWYSIH